LDQRRKLLRMRLSLFRQNPLKFEIGQFSQHLVLSRRVVKHFEKHKQKRPTSLEAGGQLFARLSLPQLIIERATGPRPSDFGLALFTFQTVRPNNQRLITGIRKVCITSETGTPIPSWFQIRPAATVRVSENSLLSLNVACKASY
jgi:hypothetical protein